MLDIIIYIISFFVTIPIIASLLVYIISMIVERNKLKAIHNMVAWTTCFYIIAVAIMLTLILDRSFVGVILIFFLVLLSLIVFIQWKTKRDIELKRAVKLLWRISFLLFFFLYGCFLIMGIIKQLAV